MKNANNPYKLDESLNLCKNDSHKAIIVSRDKGSKCSHTANNVDGDEVKHFQVDGDVIKDKTINKCDFLLLNTVKKNAYFIELKGSDIRHAIIQVENTKELLTSQLKGYNYLYRIVYKSGTHDLQSNEVIKWKNKNRRNQIIKQLDWKENI